MNNENEEFEEFEEMMPSDSGENHQETKEEKKPKKSIVEKVFVGFFKLIGKGVGFINPLFSKAAYKVAHPKISKAGKKVIDEYSEQFSNEEIEDYAKENGIIFHTAEYILSLTKKLVTESKEEEKQFLDNGMPVEEAKDTFSIREKTIQQILNEVGNNLDQERINNFAKVNDLATDEAKQILSVIEMVQGNENICEDIKTIYRNDFPKKQIVAYANRNDKKNEDAILYLSIERLVNDSDSLIEAFEGILDKSDEGKNIEKRMAKLIKTIVSGKNIDVRKTINSYFEAKVSLDAFCNLAEHSKIKEKTAKQIAELLDYVLYFAEAKSPDTVENIFEVCDAIDWDQEKIKMLQDIKHITGESIKTIYKIMDSKDMHNQEGEWSHEKVEILTGIARETGIYNSKYILKQLINFQFNKDNTLRNWKNPLNIKGKLKFLLTIAKLALTGLGVFKGYEMITNQPQEPSAYSAHLEVENDDLVKDGMVAIERDKVIGEPAKVNKEKADVYFSGEKVVIIDGNEAIYTTIKKLGKLGIEVAPDEVEGHIYTEGEFSNAKKIRVRDLEGNEIGKLPVGTEVVVYTAEKISGIAEDYEYIRITTEDNADSEGEKQKWSGCVVEYAVKADGEPVALEGKNNCVIELKENTSYRISADCSSDENILKKKGLNKITVASLIAGPDGIPYFKTAEGLYVPFSEIKSVKDFSGKKLNPDKLLKAIQEDLEKQQNPETINVSALSGNDRNRAFRKEKEVDDKPKKVRATVEMVSDAVVPEVPKLVEDVVQEN